MRSIWTISKREFLAYFSSPIAYVYLVTFLIVVNWLFFRSFFLIGQADMRMFFGAMPWIFLFFIPAVSMGKWADERKQGTLEVLFTLPLKDSDIVIAKFLAGLALISTALLLTIPIPVSILFLGSIDLGPVLGGYIGLLFLGGAYLSIGLFVSSFTENQIIAFILGVAVCFVLLVAGTPLVVGGSSNIITQAIQYAGLGMHFESISRGVLDTRDVVYYLSVVCFFLYLNLQVLRNKAF